MNLSQMLADTAGKQGAKTALIWEGESFTFTEVDRQIAVYAGLLAKLGVQPGDRMAIQLAKRKDFIFLHLANLTLGGVTLPLNSDYKTEEVQYFLSDSGSKLFVTDTVRYQKHRPALDALDVKTAVVDTQGTGDAICLPELLEGMQPIQERTYSAQDGDPAMICYTSGTTGRSKGAVISHRNLVVNMIDLQQTWRWTADDVLLHVLPLFHVHGLVVALHGSLNAGSTAIIHEKFEPARTWKTIEQERCTMLMGVPTIYQRLINEWEKMSSVPDLSTMRVFISGSAPLTVKLFETFEKTTGFRILERYGMTETGMNTSNAYEPEGRKPGSVGFALPNVSLRVATQEGKDVTPGEVGEVLLRGDNVFKGYWRMPDKTRESFVEGWFQTGDLGYQDPEDDMRLYLVGRAKELIITGGYNVYPKEIEAVIDAHPAVSESAVVGLPDDDFGERVTAAVVLKKEIPAPPQKEIIAHCKEKLAGYKCPKEIIYLNTLPRNAMGKIRKNLIVEQYGK
jgi:malonyl-CoA/methylmalonyl-CoA synthetase